MKLFLKSIATITVLFGCMQITFAQSTPAKKKVFENYPNSIPLQKNNLQQQFNSKEGDVAKLILSPTFTFEGRVISNKSKYGNMQTIIIQSLENNNSFFEITKNISPNKTETIVGRIMNSDAADGYVIKNNNENYTLTKISTQKILEPCSQ